MAESHNSTSAEAESRYIYYLLAASAAALGFTVEKAPISATTAEFFLFLAATFSWSTSFYLGLRAVQVRLTSLNILANAENLEKSVAQSKKLLPQADWPEINAKFLEAVGKANEALATSSLNFEKYLTWQFRMVSTGAAAYVAWKLLPLWA